jgi:ribosomal protein L44E
MVVVPFMVYTKKHSSRPVSNYKRVADILSSRDARSTSRKKTYGHHSRKGTKGLD